MKNLDAVKQQAVLDRIDRLESFANAALSLADEMRKALPKDIEESGVTL
ncbi:hypothetical protein SR914_18995 [Comamonas testosteroni]|nr:hypothetical protein [Comamonas testosteroni]WQG65276.1 hypothetical protein SR914_18995 [Comamonas testosteroni]